MSNATNAAFQLKLTPVWSSAKIRELVDASDLPGGPAILRVGQREKEALLIHLREAFGDRSFADHELYYMGMRVQVCDEEEHLSVGEARRTVVRHRSDDILDKVTGWRFSFGN